MRIVVAPDSFKGSLSSLEIVHIVKEEAQAAFPGAEVVGLPIADGGEGTVEALLFALGGERRELCVTGPLGESIPSFYGALPGGEAAIESAAACGLPLVPQALRNPMKTTSYGVGELIAHALEAGHRRIFIGLGGSATNDGGLGALSALGARFLDDAGRPVPPCGEGLERVYTIDTSGLRADLRGAEIILLADVTNPLTGPTGAAAIFAPQKGATPDMVAALDRGLAHFATVALAHGFDLRAPIGAGAAGGLGGALCAFLKAEIRSGIGSVLELLRFEDRLAGCDLALTGEGRVDGQSLFGKAVGGVAARCRERGVPCVILAGGVQEGFEALRAPGLCEVVPIVDRPLPLDEAMTRAADLVRGAVARVFGLWVMAKR